MRINIGLLAIVALLLTTPLRAEKKAINPPELNTMGTTSLPFSPGMLVDGTLYVAGQIGRDLKTGAVPEDFEQEVKLCLSHIETVLKAANMGFKDVVSVQVYLTDVELFGRMNAVYGAIFKDPRPARTTVGIAKLVVPNARVEITVTARK